MQPRTLEFIRGLREFESMGWRAGWSVRELATRLRRTWRESNRREMVNYFLTRIARGKDAGLPGHRVRQPTYGPCGGTRLRGAAFLSP